MQTIHKINLMVLIKEKLIPLFHKNGKIWQKKLFQRCQDQSHFTSRLNIMVATLTLMENLASCTQYYSGFWDIYLIK